MPTIRKGYNVPNSDALNAFLKNSNIEKIRSYSEDDIKNSLLPYLLLTGDLENMSKVFQMYPNLTPMNVYVTVPILYNNYPQKYKLNLFSAAADKNIPNKDEIIYYFLNNYMNLINDAYLHNNRVFDSIFDRFIKYGDPSILSVLSRNRTLDHAIIERCIVYLVRKNDSKSLDILLKYLNKHKIVFDIESIITMPYGDDGPELNILEYAIFSELYDIADYLLDYFENPMSSRQMGHPEIAIYKRVERTLDPSILLKLNIGRNNEQHMSYIIRKLLPILIGKCKVQAIDKILSHYKIDILRLYEFEDDLEMSLLEYALKYGCEELVMYLLSGLKEIPDYVPQKYINAMKYETRILNNNINNSNLTTFEKGVRNLPWNVKQHVIRPYLHATTRNKLHKSGKGGKGGKSRKSRKSRKN